VDAVKTRKVGEENCALQNTQTEEHSFIHIKVTSFAVNMCFKKYSIKREYKTNRHHNSVAYHSNTIAKEYFSIAKHT
jgi:hypothetical protein